MEAMQVAILFVQDMAEGLMKCALNGTPGDIYNLATERKHLFWI